MYREQDEVYVFNEGKLSENEMVIRTVNDDEEQFVLEGKNEEGKVIELEASRSHIMEEDEVDKIAALLIEQSAWELDAASDNDEVHAFLNDELEDYITVYHDETIDGLVMTLASSFSTVQEFEEWFKETFSHYSQNGIYKLDGTYYAVTIG